MLTPVRVRTLLQWSGGKDSAFTLWRLHGGDYDVRALFTTFVTFYGRVYGSGLRPELVRQQAAALNLPLIEAWIPPVLRAEDTDPEYVRQWVTHLSSADVAAFGHVAWGDIFSDARDLHSAVMEATGKTGLYPLWQEDSSALAGQILATGIKAVVVNVDRRVLDPSFAGREFDESFLADLPDSVDPCGENGEYQTFVYDGPLFATPVQFHRGQVKTLANHVYCDLQPG